MLSFISSPAQALTVAAMIRDDRIAEAQERRFARKAKHARRGATRNGATS
jgi:hypothetical protein